MSRKLPRCRLEPLPSYQVAFLVDERERMRWHGDPRDPRPFLYPVRGPAGKSLVRMGHPGAPDHDHHRGVWLAHHDVEGHSFWSDQAGTRVVQRQWLAYLDGDEESVMAVALEWRGPDDAILLEEERIVALRPLPQSESLVEIQSAFRVPDGEPRRERVVLGHTNFGFFAVRVARSLSAHFGGGVLSDSEGRSGEPAIFDQEARWVDYSGPVQRRAGSEEAWWEGITCFDHRENPSYPAAWHVRDDGWMGPSLCRREPFELVRGVPLTLRYLLHVHGGPVNAMAAREQDDAFQDRPEFRVQVAGVPHEQFRVTRG